MKIACFAFEVVREIPGHVDPPPTAVSSRCRRGRWARPRTVTRCRCSCTSSRRSSRW